MSTSESGSSAARVSAMATHPLLRSSRGRVLWPEQRHTRAEMTLDAHSTIENVPDHAQTAPSVAEPRQRTSSVTSVETIRAKPKLASAAWLLKPKPSLGLEGSKTAKRPTRKRTHSATSPELDDDDSARQAGPRVRQRTDSLSTGGLVLADVENDPSRTFKAMPSTAASALKKLKGKLMSGQAHADEAIPAVPRLPLATKLSTPSVPERANAHSPSEFNAVFKSPTTPEFALPTAKPEPSHSLPNDAEPRPTPIQRPRAIPTARLNKYGCYEPDIEHFELNVVFPSTSRSNFEVWDQEDEYFVVGPLALHLTLKEPAKWEGLPLSHPEISILELTCSTKPVVDTAHPYARPAVATYQTLYDGAEMRTPGGRALPADPARGIAVDPVWLRTYPDSPSTSSASGQKNGKGMKRGWKTEFIVPLQTRLFDKCETRAFRVEARIAVWGQEVAAEGETMNVSHLMREREMVKSSRAGGQR